MVFLNMKQVKKDNFELENKLNKITKLAIGKPGGADFSSEEWELQLSVRCLLCQITIGFEKDVKYFSINIIFNFYKN